MRNVLLCQARKMKRHQWSLKVSNFPLHISPLSVIVLYALKNSFDCIAALML